MNKVYRAAKSLLKIAYWKCRYGARLHSSWVQGFDRARIELSGNGQIKLGTRIQNRGELFLVCGGDGRLEIGNHVICSTSVYITSLGHVKIGDYSRLGNHVVIVDHDHNFKNKDGEYLIGEVTIGKRVWIGANCTILKGTHIGDDSVIAAGSVVRGDVPARTLYYQKREIQETLLTQEGWRNDRK